MDSKKYIINCIEKEPSKVSCEEQIKINEIIKTEGIEILFPFEQFDKKYFDNVAFLVQEYAKNVEIGKNELLIKALFERMQDMNWPGSDTILEILYTLDRESLVRNIEYIVENNIHDEEWIYYLAFHFIEELNIVETDFRNGSIYAVLVAALD